MEILILFYKIIIGGMLILAAVYFDIPDVADMSTYNISKEEFSDIKKISVFLILLAMFI